MNESQTISCPMHKMNQRPSCAASRSKSEPISQHTLGQSCYNPIIYKKNYVMQERIGETKMR